MIDRFEKRALVVALTLVLTFFAFLVYAAKGLGTDLPTCLPEAKPFTQGELIQLGEKRYQLNAVAKMWNFEPNEIKIPAGSTVDIYVVSADVMHGFYVPNTLINLMAIPKVVNYTRVKFDKPGTYEILCHEYCGVFHQNMAGKIIVE